MIRTPRGRSYEVRIPMPVGGRYVRPNRLAAGMTYTGYRSRHGMGNDTALQLRVRGTTDALSRGGGLTFCVERTARVCACCGQRLTGLCLNDRGRKRLSRLRAARGQS